MNQDSAKHKEAVLRDEERIAAGCAQNRHGRRKWKALERQRSRRPKKTRKS